VHPVSVPLELLGPGLVFAAGGFYVAVRSALNQLTAKTAELERRASANHYRMTIVALAMCPENRRDQVASWLLQSIIGD